MMKKILGYLAFVPMYAIAILWMLAIYSKDYYFIAMKVNAAIGLLTIYYGLYKFTLYLQKKLNVDEFVKKEKQEELGDNND